MVSVLYECISCGKTVELMVNPDEIDTAKLPRYWCFDEYEGEHRLFCTKRCMRNARANDKFAEEEERERERQKFAIDALRWRKKKVRRCIPEKPYVTNLWVSGTDHRNIFDTTDIYSIEFNNGMRITGIHVEQIHLPESLYEEELRK